MKKGRRSLKKVSKALRFTSAGSASTWPKSGFTVASSVRLGPKPTFRSAPVRTEGSRVSWKGAGGRGGVGEGAARAPPLAKRRAGAQVRHHPPPPLRPHPGDPLQLAEAR